MLSLLLIVNAQNSCPCVDRYKGACTTNPAICSCYNRRAWRPFHSSEAISYVAAYRGADCSERTCPEGYAWADAPKGNNDHTQLLECSGRGTCDYKTGKCKCFQGSWGIGCRKSECPNKCSGHGICQSLQRTAADSDHTYRHWDATLNFGCLCDAGYRGPDCSLIDCPSGYDIYGLSGSPQGRECSGRGTCDYTTGFCTCFQGIKGAACEDVITESGETEISSRWFQNKRTG